MSQTQDRPECVASRPPSQAVVERVAACEGVDPIELTPLYEVIDPDALNGLVERAGGRDGVQQIVFRYCGYDVTVTGEGVVHLARRTDSNG